MSSHLATKRAQSFSLSTSTAVNEIVHAFEGIDLAGVIFFASPTYDLAQLAQMMDNSFSCPVIGCSSSGEMNSSFEKNSLIALGFSKEAFTFHVRKISGTSEFTSLNAKALIDEIKASKKGLILDPSSMFCFLLNDGLAMQEEHITSILYHALGGISLFGGSAGDNLAFQRAPVYYEGAFHEGDAVFALIETTLDFEILKIQHYHPSSHDLVITKADPKNRRVYEINGGPAAEEFAQLLGISKEELTPEVYSKYPVMIQIGNEWYVRSIREKHHDDSLTFYCAIDKGIPLTVGEGDDIINSFKASVEAIHKQFKQIDVTLGCDCILRRIEAEEKHLNQSLAPLLESIHFFGFNTYGEQLNAIHINQTLTCIVLGEKR